MVYPFFLSQTTFSSVDLSSGYNDSMTEVVTEIVPIPFIFLLIVYSYREYSNILNNKRNKTSFFHSNIIYFHILATKYSHFFHIIPSLLPEKNHMISYIILVGQKKTTKISLLLKSQKSSFGTSQKLLLKGRRM